MNRLNTFKKAREALRRAGWIQGSYGQEKIGYCSMGALFAAADSTYALEVCADKLANIIREQYPELPYHGSSNSGLVIRWNDELAQSQAEVEAIFEKAIAKEEEQL